MAIRLAIIDKVIAEIQNIIGCLLLDQNGIGTGTSVNDQGLGNNREEPNTKLTKKDSRSTLDLKENVDLQFTPTRLEKKVMLLISAKNSYGSF